MRAVELFAGAGGLGMGLSFAGIKPVAVVEWDKWACDTIRENQQRGFPLVRDWPLFEDDVRDWIKERSADPELRELDVVAGGPPCQPFSLGGKHRAHHDSRDMFPVTVEVIRHLKPKAFIIENVKGLTRSSFHNYYQYILLQFEFPEVVRRADESWSEHYGRLQQKKTAAKVRGVNGLTYNVVPKLLNASNHGVPQRRERVFIIGFRTDLGVKWRFPRETHSYHALLHNQWVSGQYWERHEIPKAQRPPVPDHVALVVERLRGLGLEPTTEPWRTTRDALLGLSDPEDGDSDHYNHRFQPGARPYYGHTGSQLDMPAKTLKAGDHGVPGGENMLVLPNGSCRYFTVRESARLQTFPDGYVFHGSWTETMRQLGNAVPVRLARIVAASVATRLADTVVMDAMKSVETKAPR